MISTNHRSRAYGNNSIKQFDDSSAYGNYVSFDLDGYTASQLRFLKQRLNSELEQVRILRNRIESGTFVSGPVYTTTAPSFDDEVNGGVLKKKKLKIGQGQKGSNPVTLDRESEKLLATCDMILAKLMKQKWSSIFNKPVDVLGLGLHDYHLFVKKPMDLGTVKLNLEKGFYTTPNDFASDVRLTFNNAMAYNPKGHDVYLLAEKLLGQFDAWFNPKLKRFEAQQHKVMGSSSRPESELNQKVWNQNRVAKIRRKRPELITIAQNQVSVKPLPTLPTPVMQLPRVPSPSPSPPLAQLPPPPQPVSQVEAPLDAVEATKGRKGKSPKPKAKDPNKRQMTMEEKTKLGLNLEELPPENLEQLIEILRKRTRHLSRDGDEIELDIEALDTETLWELDRFYTNYKKKASQIKRQGSLQNVSTPPRNMPLVTDMGSAEERKGGEDAGEEDVDIGEDIPIEDYPSVEIKRDGTAASGGSSSSSRSSSSSSPSVSSSSSDSEWGSSSGSHSDADSVHLPKKPSDNLLKD